MNLEEGSNLDSIFGFNIREVRRIRFGSDPAGGQEFATRVTTASLVERCRRRLAPWAARATRHARSPGRHDQNACAHVRTHAVRRTSHTLLPVLTSPNWDTSPPFDLASIPPPRTGRGTCVVDSQRGRGVEGEAGRSGEKRGGRVCVCVREV